MRYKDFKLRLEGSQHKRDFKSEIALTKFKNKAALAAEKSSIYKMGNKISNVMGKQNFPKCTIKKQL